MDDVARCVGPGCSRPLTPRSTGRPARYCGPNCRKRAQRERDRRAGAERQRVAQLAKAQAAVTEKLRHLEEHIDRAVDLEDIVVQVAARDDWHHLARVLAAYRAEAAGIEIAAVQYFEAAAHVRQLTGPSAARPARLSSVTPLRG